MKSGTAESGMIFFPARDEEAEALLREHRIPSNLTDKTVILLDNQKIYIKSAAIIKALQNKGGWWKLAGLLRIIPSRIRDFVYDFFARNR